MSLLSCYCWSCYTHTYDSSCHIVSHTHTYTHSSSWLLWDDSVWSCHSSWDSCGSVGGHLPSSWTSHQTVPTSSDIWWWGYSCCIVYSRPRLTDTHPWIAAIYDIADTLFSPKHIYICLCTIKTPEMWKPLYSVKCMVPQSQQHLNCTKFFVAWEVKRSWVQIPCTPWRHLWS